MSFSSLSISEALRRRDFGVIADWFIVFFFGSGVTGIVFAGMAAGSGNVARGLRVFALALIFGGACVICGWVLGLLFGIPRVLSRSPSNPTLSGDGGRVVQTLRVNTNLEDVSDWLTKTLIGVGLTQLYLVPNHLWSIASKLNSSGFVWDPYGPLLALALFLYFLPGGFWLGYVITRTILTKLLDQLEGADPSVIRIALARKQLQLTTRGNEIVPSDDETKRADEEMLKLSLGELTQADELAAWGVAKARAGDLDAAVTALREALKMDKSKDDYRELLATVFTLREEEDNARSTLGDKLSETIVFWDLYDEPPGGFTKAIDHGEALERSGKISANVFVWLACAYGQKYKYLQDHDPAQAPAALSKVYEYIEKAIKSDPSVKSVLRSSWRDHRPENEDDDLRSVPLDDKKMTELLGSEA